MQGSCFIDTNVLVYCYSTTDAAKYGFPFYDYLIVSSALEAKCYVLYSEDMQHNQFIEDQLRIINPFIERFAGQREQFLCDPPKDYDVSVESQDPQASNLQVFIS